MNIFYFSQGFGLSPFIKRQAEDVGSVHNVLYLCTAMDEWAKGTTVKVITEPFRELSFVSRVRNKLERMELFLNFFNPFFAKNTTKVIRSFRPDIIHCQFGYEALILLDNIRYADYPVLISFRGFDASQKLRNRLYKKRLRNLLSQNNVYSHFVCEHLRDNLLKAGITLHDSKVIYSNTNVEFFKRENRTRNFQEIKLLHVSTLREKKGHEYTLRAFKSLLEKRPDKNLILIMTGFDDKNPRYGVLRKLITDLGIETNVTLIDFVSPQQVKDLMEEAHAVLLHSITTKDGDQEGIPNVLMEAMAMELPVVSTLHAGIPELVDNGVNGILVSERDIEGYTDALDKIIEWDFVYESREKIVNYFSQETHMQSLLSYYDQIRLSFTKPNKRSLQ